MWMCANGSRKAQVGQEKGGLAVSGLMSPSGFGWEVIHRWVQSGFARNGGSSHNFGAAEMFSLPEGLMPELAGSVFVLCRASRSRQEGVPALGAGMLAPT